VPIDDLKTIAGFTGGFAKSNRFMVEMPNIPNPFNDGRSPYLTGPGITLLCESTSMPGKQISTFEYPYKLARNDIKVPNGYFNEDVTFSFILTNDYFVKNLFESWMEAIIPKKDYLLNYPAAYERDITVHQLDEQDRTVYSIKLFGAYPTSINSIELNNESSSTIGKLPVTFTYIDYAKL
jgi:hypothetical protein